MRLLLFANTDWYLYNFRLSLATALRDQGHEVLLVSPTGSYGQRLRNAGFEWLPAPMSRRSLNPIRELSTVLWLRRLLLDRKIDLVHGFTIKCAVYGALAARMAGTPARIGAVAGMGYVFSSDEIRARALRPVLVRIMRLALDGEGARLILQNPDDVQHFVRNRLADPSRVRLVQGSGVDCDRFYPGQTTEQRSNRPLRILMAARLLRDKGLMEYVEAARKLRDEGRNIDFLLAGEPDPGNPAAIAPTQLQEWVHEGVINWLGHVEDMPNLLRSVDVAVLPSYREGLPKGLIEAAACGLPLVTTDVPGCREVVTDGVEGLLVPAKDSVALAHAIAKMQDNPELRASYGAAARSRAVGMFNQQLVVAGTIAVYRELLPETPSDAAGP